MKACGNGSAARALAMDKTSAQSMAARHRKGRLFMSLMDSNWPELIQLHWLTAAI
jgi:hypothetical protein